MISTTGITYSYVEARHPYVYDAREKSQHQLDLNSVMRHGVELAHYNRSDRKPCTHILWDV